MKFTVFRWWEKIIKPFMYTLVGIITIFAIYGFFMFNSQDTAYAFIVPIGYALFLFIVTMIMEKAQRYIDSQLFDRVDMYYWMQRLTDVVKNSVGQIDPEKVADVKIKVELFRKLTDRDADSNEKSKIRYVKEEGFNFSKKLERLESKVIDSETECSKKEIRKLVSYYRRGCKELQKNLVRLDRVYGGALKNILERDKDVSEANYYFDEICRKLNDVKQDVEEANETLGEVLNTEQDIKRAVQNSLPELINEGVEWIDDKFGCLIDSKTRSFATKTEKRPERQK